jgi:hypothetical protein
MTTHTKSQFTRYMFALVLVGGIAGGSVWAGGERQEIGVAGIDVTALMSTPKLSNLPVLEVSDPI